MAGRTAIALAATLAAAGLAAPAAAERTIAYVSDAVERLEWAMRYQGSSTLAWGIVDVRAGNELRGTFSANSSQRVTVGGACDRDCTRIRVRVLDYRGAQIAVSEGHNGAATVVFNPYPGQTYTVLTMPMNCGTPTCFTAWEAAR